MTNDELLSAITMQIGEFRKEVNDRFNGIEERIDSLEENGEITRDGVNALLDWADIIGRINKHPIAK